MGDSVTLCDVILFKVCKATISNLKRFDKDNILIAVACCLEIDNADAEKLHLYSFSKRLSSESFSERLSSVVCYNDITLNLNTTLLVVNLFKLGMTSINMDIFNQDSNLNEINQINEWHQALQLLEYFVKQIQQYNDEFNKLAENCLQNKFIYKRLSDYIYNNHDNVTIDQKVPVLFSNLSKSDNISSVVDSFQSVAHYWTLELCKILNTRMQKYRSTDLAQVLRSGEFKIITTCKGKQIKLHSEVLDHIRLAAARRTLGALLPQHLGSLELLGEGGFGEAYKFSSRDFENVHIVIKSSKLQEKYDNPGWKREVENTRKMSHDNIIKYYGMPIIYNGMIYNVMEYCGISIRKSYYDIEVMPEENIEKAMLAVASGLNYLHSSNDGKYLVHRDIRSDNITVNDDGVYKIIDFGMSSETTVENSRFGSEMEWGNPFWKSPEWCRYESEHWTCPDIKAPGRKSDIWSFGVFVLEMKAFPRNPDHFNLNRDQPGQPDYYRYRIFCCGLINNSINLLDYVKDEWSDKIKNIVKICFEFSEDLRADSKALLELCEGEFTPD